MPPGFVIWVPQNPDLLEVPVGKADIQTHLQTTQSQALGEIPGSPKLEYRAAKCFHPPPVLGVFASGLPEELLLWSTSSLLFLESGGFQQQEFPEF